MIKTLINIVKGIGFASLSLALVIGIFIGGFAVGSKSTSPILQSTGEVSALTAADLKPFWKTWAAIDEKFVAATSSTVISDTDRVYGAIEGMVDSLGDPYTTFLPPQDNESFQESIRGNFQGVGMEVGRKDGVLVVIAPLKDTPAEKSGIKAGDIIARIEQTSTMDLSVDEAIDLIRGEKGTTVNLTLLRDGEDAPIIVDVVRDTITIPIIEFEERSDGIFVISLYSFTANVEAEFRKAIRAFIESDSNKLVLDVRGNPGGFLDAAVDIASWFLPKNAVIVREDFGSNREEKVFKTNNANAGIFNNNLKMVILVDEGSASASEIVAGALREQGVATLVGRTTFGKGSVQELVKITNDTALKVTIARWLTPNGVSISEGGLTPDVDVIITKEDSEAGIDTQLEKAIEILNN